MAHHTAIEFNTTRQPSVSDSQVAGTDNGVIVEQMPPRDLVVERPQAAAQLGEEQGLEVVILQHHTDVGSHFLGAVVEILHAVGENGGEEAVAHEELVILVQSGAGEALDVGHLVEGGEGGFTVEMSRGEEDFAYGHRHGGDSF